MENRQNRGYDQPKQHNSQYQRSNFSQNAAYNNAPSNQQKEIADSLQKYLTPSQNSITQGYPNPQQQPQYLPQQNLNPYQQNVLPVQPQMNHPIYQGFQYSTNIANQYPQNQIIDPRIVQQNQYNPQTQINTQFGGQQFPTQMQNPQVSPMNTFPQPIYMNPQQNNLQPGFVYSSFIPEQRPQQINITQQKNPITMPQINQQPFFHGNQLINQGFVQRNDQPQVFQQQQPQLQSQPQNILPQQGNFPSYVGNNQIINQNLAGVNTNIPSNTLQPNVLNIHHIPQPGFEAGKNLPQAQMNTLSNTNPEKMIQSSSQSPRIGEPVQQQSSPNVPKDTAPKTESFNWQAIQEIIVEKIKAHFTQNPTGNFQEPIKIQINDTQVVTIDPARPHEAKVEFTNKVNSSSTSITEEKENDERKSNISLSQEFERPYSQESRSNASIIDSKPLRVKDVIKERAPTIQPLSTSQTSNTSNTSNVSNARKDQGPSRSRKTTSKRVFSSSSSSYESSSDSESPRRRKKESRRSRSRSRSREKEEDRERERDRRNGILSKKLEQIKNENAEKKETKLSFFIDTTPIAIVKEQDPEKHTKTLELQKNIEGGEKFYKLLGQDRSFKTQEKNLVEKLNKFLVNPEPLKEEKKEEDDEEIKAEKARQEEEEETNPEFNFESRYYFYNPTQVCNRCKKPGHFERWCPEEVKIKCLFCVGRHRTEECTQIVCFNCYNVGHRAKDCNAQQNMACYRCGKKGHKNNQCGVIMLKDKENGLREKKLFMSSVTCLACNEKGHINCQSRILKLKKGYIDDLYVEEDITIKEDTIVQNAMNLPDSEGNQKFIADSSDESDGSYEDLGDFAEKRVVPSTKNSRHKGKNNNDHNEGTHNNNNRNSKNKNHHRSNSSNGDKFFKKKHRN